MEKEKLPEGWKWEIVKDVCKVVNGSTPKTSISEYWNGDILWITPKDLSNFSDVIISNTSRKITQKGYNSCSTTMVPAGSVLMSSRAPIGFLGIAGKDICTNQGFKSFVCSDAIHNKYLYYYLKSIVPRLQREGSGATFSEISKTKVENINLIVPPFKTQQEIADKIDKQMSQIEMMAKSAEKQKRAMNCWSKAYLQNIYSNLKKCQQNKIGDFFVTRYGLSKPSVNDPTKIPAVRMSNISYEGDLFLDELTYLDLSEAELNKHKLKKNDLLFNRTNSAELVGKTTVFDCDDTFVSVSYIVVATPKTNEINSKYVAFYLNNPEMKKYFTENCNRAISQANFSATKLSNIDIPIPNLNVQNEIVHKIENMKSKISDMKQILDKQLNAINQLSESILNDVFGKYELPDEV